MLYILHVLGTILLSLCHYISELVLLGDTSQTVVRWVVKTVGLSFEVACMRLLQCADNITCSQTVSLGCFSLRLCVLVVRGCRNALIFPLLLSMVVILAGFCRVGVDFLLFVVQSFIETV